MPTENQSAPSAQSFHGRVIDGTCYVVMYDSNEIVIPNDNCLTINPKLTGLLNNLAPTP
jgi:hypothetical protein